MVTKEQPSILSPQLFWALIGYRIPMRVRDLRVFANRSSYYVCPRCSESLDREYMAYCNCCGQCLDWKQLRKADVIWMHK